MVFKHSQISWWMHMKPALNPDSFVSLVGVMIRHDLRVRARVELTRDIAVLASRCPDTVDTAIDEPECSDVVDTTVLQP